MLWTPLGNNEYSLMDDANKYEITGLTLNIEKTDLA